MSALRLLPGIQKNISLSNHTTFRIGGAARYFYVAKSKEEIIAAVGWAKANPPAGGLPFFVLGGGSNLLVSDRGFDGLIVRIQNLTLRLRSGQEFTIIEAGVGVPLAKLVAESVNNGLTGLEWAMGIPGTIGGAVFGNAGAYGHSISENVEEVRVINGEGKEAKEAIVKKEDCGFGYRESIFKKTGDIILEVVLKLRAGDKEKSQALIKDIISNRQGKIPTYHSAGSVFKNYELRNTDYETDPLIKRFPELREKIKGGKIAVGYLIEQCGLKGEKVGNAMIAQEHANFIVNLGGAKAEDVVALIKLCKEKVKEKFGIELEEEIRYLGFT